MCLHFVCPEKVTKNLMQNPIRLAGLKHISRNVFTICFILFSFFKQFETQHFTIVYIFQQNIQKQKKKHNNTERVCSSHFSPWFFNHTEYILKQIFVEEFINL